MVARAGRINVELVHASQEGEVIVGQIGPVKVEQGDVAFPVRLDLRAPCRQPIGKRNRGAGGGFGRRAGGSGLPQAPTKRSAVQRTQRGVRGNLAGVVFCA